MKAALDERVLFGVGDRVRIAKPAKGHAHIRGWEGRVARVDTESRYPTPVIKYHVQFSGGYAEFTGHELEIVSAAAPAFEIAEGGKS